jgi:cell division GTPase FtsZ
VLFRSIDPELEGTIQITVIATGFSGDGYIGKKPEVTAKTSDSDFIDYNEYVRMVERTKHPEYLSPFLPQREYQDDLDVPSVIRKNYHSEEKQLELTEKQ